VEKIHAAIASRRSFNAGIWDAARQAYMVIRSHHRQLLDGMEYAHFPQWASGSAYIHVEPVQDEGNFKLKKQVALTATLIKELDSTMEEVEFWQKKVWRSNEDHLKDEASLSSGFGDTFGWRDKRV
jgi:hypothetical protein